MPRKLAEIPVDLLQLPPGYRLSRMAPVRAAELEEVRACGVLRPVCVRPLPRATGAVQRYEIVAQARSWILAQRAGVDPVPAYVCDDLDPDVLSYIDRSEQEQTCLADATCARERVQRGSSVARVAAEMGIARTVLSHRLRVLGLPDAIRRLIEEGKLTVGHARPLVTLNAEHAWRLAQAAVAQGWSVRRMEKEARDLRGHRDGARAERVQPGPARSTAPDRAEADVRQLEAWLSERVHARVRIGPSDIRIETGGNLDVIDGILEVLGFRP